MVKKLFERKINRYVYEVFAGEYHVTKEQNVAFKTLLGSCVAVCMVDMINGVSGMNHFMLPSTRKIEDIVFDEDARYGMNAMELLINNMMKLGANRDNLEAKVFGGARVMNTSLNNVAQSNVDFILTYLSMEDIPIRSKNLGGRNGRKIYFFPDSFNIYQKRIGTQQKIEQTVAEEKQLLDQIKKKKEDESDLTFFD